MSIAKELAILIKHEFKKIHVDFGDNNDESIAYLDARVRVFDTVKSLFNNLFDEYGEIVSLKMLSKEAEEAKKYSEYFDVILIGNRYVVEYQVYIDTKSNKVSVEVVATSEIKTVNK